jgi:ATP/maltotriose-dependent transcriptional regulator MalT
MVAAAEADLITDQTGYPGAKKAAPLLTTKLHTGVLRLPATSLPAADIADDLFIAVSTVHSRTKSIYAKLNVHRCLDAVDRAKELDLI